MPDYAGNSKRAKQDAGKPEKHVEKVVATEAVVMKKSLGRKFKDIFIAADFKSVMRAIFNEVLIPAARNTIVDATDQGVKRMMYGEATMRRRAASSGPRITYNNPINRGGYGGPGPSRPAALVPGESRSPRYQRDDFILSSREEAELVVERMQDIIDNYEVVSVGDLNDLVGLPTTYMDNKWGWTYIGDVQIRQIREGYLIDLPSAEPIQ